MELQRRLAASVLKCGPRRIRFDNEQLEEIKKAITTFDVRRLVKSGQIRRLQIKGVSRARANKVIEQKRKGRRSGHGSRKGTTNARHNDKSKWVATVRKQRELLKTLRDGELIAKDTFNLLYRRVKGGFFRSKNHIKVYLRDQNLIVRK